MFFVFPRSSGFATTTRNSLFPSFRTSSSKCGSVDAVVAFGADEVLKGRFSHLGDQRTLQARGEWPCTKDLIRPKNSWETWTWAGHTISIDVFVCRPALCSETILDMIISRAYDAASKNLSRVVRG